MGELGTQAGFKVMNLEGIIRDKNEFDRMNLMSRFSIKEEFVGTGIHN